MIIWDTLVKESEENKDLTYTLKISPLLKVGHQFYQATPRYEIDHKTIRAMKNLKAALEKKEKDWIDRFFEQFVILDSKNYTSAKTVEGYVNIVKK